MTNSPDRRHERDGSALQFHPGASAWNTAPTCPTGFSRPATRAIFHGHQTRPPMPQRYYRLRWRDPTVQVAITTNPIEPHENISRILASSVNLATTSTPKATRLTGSPLTAAIPPWREARAACTSGADPALRDSRTRANVRRQFTVDGGFGHHRCLPTPGAPLLSIARRRRTPVVARCLRVYHQQQRIDFAKDTAASGRSRLRRHQSVKPEGVGRSVVVFKLERALVSGAMPIRSHS